MLESPLFLTAAGLGALGILLVLGGLVSFYQLKLMRFAFRTLLGLLLLALGALCGTVSVGIQGYRALTREEVAARILVKPTAPQRFTATFRFPDGREATYAISGDEIYVDAHILKWSPYANWIGLHTAYELDRVAGRYHATKDEKAAERTVHALAPDRPVDLYALRRRYTFLAPLLDAEYGSATFIPVTRDAEFDLRVSTTGLLIREAATKKQ